MFYTSQTTAAGPALEERVPQDDIVVRGLTKRFGTLTAVDDISFAVRRGEVFGILGPNGAGKTTTLECIEGLQDPTSGSIAVLGLDPQRESRTVKERIGIQLQASTYFDNLKVRELLNFFGSLYPKRLPIDGLLEKFDLTDKANAFLRDLSGGQQQRFTIAATLVSDPEVIFLDEPTAGLDPHARHGVWEFIEEMRREGRTLVLTTHYMEEAEALCDRVAIMNEGRIAALDTPEGLVEGLDAPHEIRARVEPAPPSAAGDALRALPAVVAVRLEDGGGLALRSSDAAKTVPAFFHWAEESKTAVTRIEMRPATLEDVFLVVTGRALAQEV